MRIAAARANVLTLAEAPFDVDRVVTLDNVLDGDDGIGALGHDTAGRDRHRLTSSEGALRRAAGGDVRDDRQPAGKVGGPHGVPVHRGAGEGRQVDNRQRRLGGHPSGGVAGSDVFGRQCPRVLEHLRLRLLHGE